MAARFVPADNARWYDVPAGTRPTECRGKDCRATIYFVESPVTGRPVPVDCDVEGGQAPSESNDPAQGDAFLPPGVESIRHGRGISHYATCPNANDFGKGRR